MFNLLLVIAIIALTALIAHFVSEWIASKVLAADRLRQQRSTTWSGAQVSLQDL
jgi:Tfp pilus assembly protein FimT